MLKFTMSCAAFGVILSTGAALATEPALDQNNGLGSQQAERRVNIKGGVFFPPMILATIGDNIIIRNDEDTTHDASAIDGSWSTGPIQPGHQAIVSITPEMTMCFKSSFNDEYKGAFGDVETGQAPECFELSGTGDGSLLNTN